MKALNVCILGEVPHGFSRFKNEIWQVNSFYHVDEFSVVQGLMCTFECVRTSENNFRSLVCWLSSATVHSEW